MWRIDSTVIDSLIHAPSDSRLLLDGVRVMGRLLAAGQALPGAPVLVWVSQTAQLPGRSEKAPGCPARMRCA